MKILVVASYYKPAYIYGGPSKSVPILCEAISRSGHEVVVFTTNANGKNNFTDIKPGIVFSNDAKIHYFNRPSYSPRRFFYSPQLGNACHDEIMYFDIVYIIGTWTYPLIPAAINSNKYNIPYIISPHGSYMDWAINRKWFKKFIYLNLIERTLINKGKYIHCTSHQEMIQTQNLGFKIPHVTIPNPIEINRFRKLPKRGKLRESLVIPDEAPVTLFVGRLHTEKRVDFMIKCFNKVLKDVKNAHLVIVGYDEDGTEDLCKNLVKELCLQENVHFTGMLKGDELLQAYTDLDLSVLFSFRENFGMGIAEAMASGLPVIIGKEVGISNFIGNEQVGIVVDVNSVELIDSWKELCTSPNIRKNIGENARSFVQKNFSDEIIAKQICSLFDQAINE